MSFDAGGIMSVKHR